MKKIFLVIFFTLFFSVSHAASEKIYLKCKKFVTENSSEGFFEKEMAEGKFGQIIITEIIINKKTVKMTVYEPFPDFGSRNDSVGKKITAPVVTKRKGMIGGPLFVFAIAGAIISGGKGTAEDKMNTLRSAGIHVCNSPAEIAITMKSLINKPVTT